MVINGQLDLLYRTLTSKFKDGKIKLLPLPGFELIGDLSINVGKIMRAMSERVKFWIYDINMYKVDFNILEQIMDLYVADEIYELERCVECGCCLFVCATKRMREDFLNAVGFMRFALFSIDSRDKRTDDEVYEIIGDDNDIFGCMTLLGCQDYCSKHLPHQI